MGLVILEPRVFGVYVNTARIRPRTKAYINNNILYHRIGNKYFKDLEEIPEDVFIKKHRNNNVIVHGNVTELYGNVIYSYRLNVGGILGKQLLDGKLFFTIDTDNVTKLNKIMKIKYI